MEDTLDEEKVRSLFNLAGIEVLGVKPLIDGYGYDPSDSRFFQTLPRCVWWFVKTKRGWVEIGWRKRVVHIDWTDTGMKVDVTSDDVTKSEIMVHAWTITKALEYLSVLSGKMNSEQSA